MPEKFDPRADIVEHDYRGDRALLEDIGDDIYRSAGCHDTDLGKLKIEYEGLEAVQVFGAKFYRFRHQGRWIVKTKGVFFRGNAEEVERLRQEKEEYVEKGFDFLQQVLVGRKSEELFRDFEKGMSATVSQQGIRKMGKNMSVYTSSKTLGFVFTRFIQDVGGLGYNGTRCFADVSEFRKFFPQGIRWNDEKGRYSYK